MTKEEFKAKVSMAYGGMDTWEEFLEAVWQLHLEASNHWIPVEERLPEHCDCLLYTEPRNIHGPFEGRFRFGFYNYADQRWEIRGEKWDNTIVTHWMPIVPPRKEG